MSPDVTFEHFKQGQRHDTDVLPVFPLFGDLFRVFSNMDVEHYTA